MAMDKATRHFGHHRVPAWLKTFVIVLGLIVVGFVAITAAENTAPPLNAVAAPAVRGVGATAATTMTVVDEQPSTADRLLHNRTRESTPHECRPDQGIVTDCAPD
jgi:hypothetical protein